MVCTQDAGPAVSVAAADCHDGWHSKSILMGGCVGQGGGQGKRWGKWGLDLRQTHSASQGETVDGWENTRREELTRRLSYHGIRSGLWETAPPEHAHTLSFTQTHPGAHSGRTLPHTKKKRVTQGNLREDWGRQLGTRQFQTNACLYLLASWHMVGLRAVSARSWC